MKTTLENTTADIKGSYRTSDGKAQIDFGITNRNGYPEFTASGYYKGSSGQCLDEIANAYPNDNQVQVWHRRWKLHHLKNAEMIVELVRAEARKFPALSFCATQSETFLTSNGLKFRATLSDSKQCPWQEGYKPHYRVTISKGKRSQYEALFKYPDRTKDTSLGVFTTAKKAHGANDAKRGSLLPAYAAKCGYRVIELVDREASRLVFDFWGNDAKPYSVLACISSDVHCPDAFEDFCSEYGYEEDSRKAFQVFQRASKFADRLRTFFTSSEVEQLSEIR